MKIRNKIIILIILVILLGVLLVGLNSPYLAMAQKITSGNTSNLLEDTQFSKHEVGGNLSLTVTGDIMFGRKMPAVLSMDSSPYEHVSNVTGDTDILLVNTENPFTTVSDAVKGDVPLKASPEYIPLINGTTGKVISANANNHLFDYGVDGMRDSMKNLDDAGITHIGVGENKQEATKPAVIEKNGHKITIFNYMDSDNFQEYSQEVMPIATDDTPGYSAWNDTESPEQIRQARENGSDFIVVYMHYGNEYSRSPNEMQEKISHAAIDAGADTVVGAHAHVTQGVEVYKDKPIYYNLGNFMFDQSNTATHVAYMVDFDIKGDNVTATLYPISISGYLPYFMSSSSGKELLSELNPQCDQMQTTEDGTGIINFKLGNNTT